MTVIEETEEERLRGLYYDMQAVFQLRAPALVILKDGKTLRCQIRDHDSRFGDRGFSFWFRPEGHDVRISGSEMVSIRVAEPE